MLRMMLFETMQFCIFMALCIFLLLAALSFVGAWLTWDAAVICSPCV